MCFCRRRFRVHFRRPDVPRQRQRQRRFQQPLPHQEQIFQGAGDVNPTGVLEQSRVTDLGNAKDLLHDLKRMFHLRPRCRLAPVTRSLDLAQGAMGRPRLLDELAGLGRHFAGRFALSPVGRIPPDSPFFAVQQRANHLRVTHPGRGGCYRVDQLAVGVHANMAFHPRAPLVALAGLMNLGITSLSLVLGRTGRVDDGRIHNGAAADSQPSRLQVFAHRLENEFSQSVGFKQVLKLAGCRTCNNILCGIHPDSLRVFRWQNPMIGAPPRVSFVYTSTVNAGLGSLKYEKSLSTCPEPRPIAVIGTAPSPTSVETSLILRTCRSKWGIGD